MTETITPTIIHKGYKPNKSIEMVKACIEHYKYFKRPVEEITLAPRYWEEWIGGMIDRFPQLEEKKGFGEVHFKNVKVRKGSIFMVKPLEAKLKVLIIDKEWKGHEEVQS